MSTAVKVCLVLLGTFLVMLGLACNRPEASQSPTSKKMGISDQQGEKPNTRSGATKGLAERARQESVKEAESYQLAAKAALKLAAEAAQKDIALKSDPLASDEEDPTLPHPC